MLPKVKTLCLPSDQDALLLQETIYRVRIDFSKKERELMKKDSKSIKMIARYNKDTP